MRKSFLVFISAIFLQASSCTSSEPITKLDTPVKNLITDPSRWYYYVCIDNRLFIEVLNWSKKDTLGFTYLNESCECLEKTVVTKSFIGSNKTEKRFILKIKEKDTKLSPEG